MGDALSCMICHPPPGAEHVTAVHSYSGDCDLNPAPDWARPRPEGIRFAGEEHLERGEN